MLVPGGVIEKLDRNIDAILALIRAQNTQIARLELAQVPAAQALPNALLPKLDSLIDRVEQQEQEYGYLVQAVSLRRLILARASQEALDRLVIRLPTVIMVSFLSLLTFVLGLIALIVV